MPCYCPCLPKRFTPPTLEDVKRFVESDPELVNIDPAYFWKVFNESGWIDTKGNPVRNWKLKIRTWSKYERPGISKTKQTTSKTAGPGIQTTRTAISEQNFGGEMFDTER